MSITIWRISKPKYAVPSDRLNFHKQPRGVGDRFIAGRWNSPKTSIVYTSATLSLAALETFVHMEIEDAGNIFVSLRADLPDDIEIEHIEPTQLPSNWRQTPVPKDLTSIGDQWFTSGKTAVLKVPSAIIPHEHNYLINPIHPDFLKIKIHSPKPFVLAPLHSVVD